MSVSSENFNSNDSLDTQEEQAVQQVLKTRHDRTNQKVWSHGSCGSVDNRSDLLESYARARLRV